MGRTTFSRPSVFLSFFLIFFLSFPFRPSVFLPFSSSSSVSLSVRDLSVRSVSVCPHRSVVCFLVVVGSLACFFLARSFAHTCIGGFNDIYIYIYVRAVRWRSCVAARTAAVHRRRLLAPRNQVPSLGAAFALVRAEVREILSHLRLHSHSLSPSTFYIYIYIYLQSCLFSLAAPRALRRPLARRVAALPRRRAHARARRGHARGGRRDVGRPREARRRQRGGRRRRRGDAPAGADCVRRQLYAARCAASRSRSSDVSSSRVVTSRDPTWRGGRRASDDAPFGVACGRATRRDGRRTPHRY